MCQNEGGYLVQIESQEESLAISEYISEESLRAHFWTGLNDRGREGDWVWDASGQQVERGFMNWKSNQPDSSGGNQDCVYMQPTESLRWGDIECSNSNHVLPVCERGKNHQSYNSLDTDTMAPLVADPQTFNKCFGHSTS